MRRAWVVPVALLLLSGGGGWGSSASGEEVYGGSGTVLDAPGRGPELCLGGILLSLPPQCSGIPLVGWDWTAVVDEESASGTTWVSAYVEGTYDGRRFTLTAPPEPPRPDERSMSFAPACEDPEAIDRSAPGSAWEAASQEAPEPIPGLVAAWVNDPAAPDWDGPFVVNVIVRPGSLEEARRFIRERWSGHLCLSERDQPPADELDAVQARLPDVLGDTLLTAHVDYRAGKVIATVILADAQTQTKVEDEFGPGLVELRGALTPVD